MMPPNLFYNGRLPLQRMADLAPGDRWMRRIREVYIWRETPIALDEWLAEVSDAREWDRHTIRLGRSFSGMAVPLGPTTGGGFTWWLGHSSRDLVPFEFLGGGNTHYRSRRRDAQKDKGDCRAASCPPGWPEGRASLERHFRLLWLRPVEEVRGEIAKLPQSQRYEIGAADFGKTRDAMAIAISRPALSIAQ